MTTQYKRIGIGKDKDRLIAIGKAHSNLSGKPTDTCIFFSLDTHCQYNEDTQDYDATVEVIWLEIQDKENV